VSENVARLARAHGLDCGDEKAWSSPRRAELEPGAAAWRLPCA
jgi:hypothetical protein